MSKFINDIIKNANEQIKYKNTVTTGEITADNGDGTYDVKIANASSAYPNVETINYDAVFSVGEIVDIIFEHGCKEAPKIIGHSKKIKQEPKQVEVDYSGETGGGVQEEIITIYSGLPQDGVLCSNAYNVYITAHNTSEADLEPFDEGILAVGQQYAPGAGGEYIIDRAVIAFDLSDIPINANITIALIKLYCFTAAEALEWFGVEMGAKWCDIDFSIIIQDGQPTYPHIPIVKADYNHNFYHNNGGSINTADINEGEFFTIILNANGRAWLPKGGIAKLLLRSSRDISIITPTGNEGINFLSGNFYLPTYPAGYRPELIITYTI